MTDEPPDPNPPRGRPRVEPGASLSIWVREHDYDKLIRLANARDVSVGALVRELLKLKL